MEITKPCPFCGSLGFKGEKVHNEKTYHYVCCHMCKMRGPLSENEEAAIRRWESRYGETIIANRESTKTEKKSAPKKEQKDNGKPITAKQCQKCRAQIYFLRNSKKDGSLGWIPVDAESLNGEDLHKLGSGELIFYRWKDHVSHFKTCPNAREF